MTEPFDPKWELSVGDWKLPEDSAWTDVLTPSGRRLLIHHDEEKDVFTTVQFASREVIAQLNNPDSAPETEPES